jgi:hypothetical protein
MMTKNKLEKSFGPVGTSAGIFLFIAGLIMIYFSLTGLILIVIGAFVGFTSSSTLIDFDKKRLKFSNNLFGLIPIGHWISVDQDMKIGLKKSNKLWRAYSRSNRPLDIVNNDFIIMLFDKNGREIMPIKKLLNIDSAKLNLDELSKRLGLSLI